MSTSPMESLPCRLQRVMFAVLANNLKVLDSHLASLRNVPTDYPNDEGHHSFAYMLFLLLERVQQRIASEDVAKEIAKTSAPLSNATQASIGSPSRPSTTEGRPARPPPKPSTPSQIIELDDDSDSSQVATGDGEREEEKREEGGEGGTRSTRPIRDCRQTTEARPKEAAKKAVDSSTTTSGGAKPWLKKCPFCQLRWDSTQSLDAVTKHLNKKHKDIPGSFLLCSACPRFRTRWFVSVHNHVKSSVCGGEAVFDHCPTWKGQTVRRDEDSSDGGEVAAKKARREEVEGSPVARNDEAQKRMEKGEEERQRGTDEGKEAGSGGDKDKDEDTKEGLVEVKTEKPA